MLTEAALVSVSEEAVEQPSAQALIGKSFGQ